MTMLVPKKHHRRSMRLVHYDYAEKGSYFITVCTYDRGCLFGDIVGIEMQMNRWGEIADECWQAIPIHFGNVELDAVVVMPNHVHGIIMITDVGATHASPLHSPMPTIPNGPKPRSIGAIIGSYKSGVSKRINGTCATLGKTVWQRNYYEHVIRNEAELDLIRQYIESNPARWAEDRENPNGKKE
ncbi:MAG: transposase [Coprothermobacterota bacterium]|nr:transposase [Coprothermobacterota bacterium]